MLPATTVFARYRLYAEVNPWVPTVSAAPAEVTWEVNTKEVVTGPASPICKGAVSVD